MATTASAAGSVVQTATASATISAAVTLTRLTNLAFGTIIKPTNANTNTVTVSNAGVRSIAGTGDGALGAGTPTAASFTLAAPAATTYSTTQTLVMTPAGLANAAANTPTTTTGTFGTVPAGGTQDLNLGGSFQLDSSTTSQAYTGTLTLTVNYN